MFGNHQDLEILQLVKTRHPNTTMISIRNISEQFRIMLEEGTRVAQCVRQLDSLCKPIINTVLVHVRLYRLPKGCTRLAASSDKVYQLLAHGRWFSPGTPASTTTRTGRHDIAEILLKLALSTLNPSINQYVRGLYLRLAQLAHFLTWL